ncbi:pilus biosynthesis protein [Pseudomonas amygdali pv. eriobotryae]|uniref:Pilus biosynthesis protein n=1 Tax=Pseudomonas amygdali pv. eriobotryae TaxID=129137 RepID=A0A9P3EET9_PSEA0|nr:prepilin-type N-terminal cleavage/methylation domain-containing protein [Pseudomonas amygdali]GFZ62856.1 pilus biosynthesis protein [Pseudomonas amygdali pv. eriobotryae]GFZ74449.1 pilus biosynthesis protein [Pseudomonas amygdali pv. eriobotryae]
MNSDRSGFSFVELMVALAIVGILAVVAYPSYMRYIKTLRAVIVSVMSKFAQAAERFYSKGGSCQNFTLASSGNSYYFVQLSSQTATGWVLKVTPISNSLMAGDTYGIFILPNSG